MKPKAFQNANPEPLDIIFYSIWTWYWLPDGLLVVEQGLIQLACRIEARFECAAANSGNTSNAFR